MTKLKPCIGAFPEVSLWHLLPYSPVSQLHDVSAISSGCDLTFAQHCTSSNGTPLGTRCHVRPLYARKFPYLGFLKSYIGQARPIYILESIPRKSLTADCPEAS